MRKLENEELPCLFRIPWGHNILLLQKLNSYDERLWYAQKTTEQSRKENLQSEPAGDRGSGFVDLD